MSCNIIRDGYTKQGYVAPAERLHDELRFTFRPMLPEEVELCEEASSKKRPKEAVEAIVAMLTTKLTTWSEVDAEGKPAPISFDNVRRLPFVVLNRLYRIVAGITATDPMPDASRDQERDYLETVIAAAKEGRQVGAMTLEAAEKN